MKLKNHNISHDLYQKMLESSTKKPYAVRFKWVRIIMWIASVFGNIASVFFAFFFFASLFNSSLVETNGIGVQIGIVFFLTIFELLKRYIFDLFSLEYIKIGQGLFVKQMTSFLISTTILVLFSFSFSMIGAKKFMNKERELEVTKQQSLKSETDSISSYYFVNYIKPIENDNKEINSTIKSYREQMKTWNTKQIGENIQNENEKIQLNMQRIKTYETQRDSAISEYKRSYTELYNKDKDQNAMNVVWFLLISATIELLILSGVYYGRYYESATIREYEKDVASKPNFKKWLKFNEILEMIYETGVKPDEQISSTAEILDLIAINEYNITKNEVENAFKVFAHLNIYQRVGNKRILKMELKDASLTLKNHFKIK